MPEREFTVKLAGEHISVRPQHGFAERYCRSYISPGTAAFTVQTTQADIDHERQRSRQEGNTADFSDAYLETLAVQRKAARGLLDYGVLLLHGSCIALDGVGYLFTAKSGTGKSTHTRLWREAFGSRAVMVNDDKPMVRITEEAVTAYGTPWNGKHGLDTNTAVPLKAICLLERGEDNTVCRVKAGRYLPVLLQTYLPEDREGIRKVLALLDRLLTRIPVYRLACNMEPEAAWVSYEAMEKGEPDEAE